MRTVDEVRDLARWILAEDRRRPLIVLTPLNSGIESYFDPWMVQPLVEDAGDVVVIAQTREHSLTRELQRLLPPGLNVFNGAARIYWPCADVGRGPSRHPLIRAESDDSSDATKRARLANRWRAGTKAPRAAQPPTATVDAAAPSESALFLDVVRAYLDLVPGSADRARFPLALHQAHATLVGQLAALEPARGPVAAAAARILSGHVWTQVLPLPERVEEGGVPVLRAADRAVGWRYPLGDGDRFLYYWQPATGPITLLRIADAALVELPDREAPGPATVEAALATPADDEPRSAPPSAGVVASASPGRFAIADRALLGALRAGGRPLMVSEIRSALDIPEDVSADVMRRILDDARGRGIIARTGQRRGTRYEIA